MPPKVLTITNQKGGTGKTTLTALLGHALVARGYNVLLMDLDPQSHLSSFFLKITDLENVRDGIIEMAQGVKFVIRKVDTSTRGRMGIIPSGLNYIVNTYRGMIPSWDPYAINSRIQMEPAINRDYNFILCDTPPELFPPTIWGLYAADYVLVPSNLEELSLAGVKLLVKDILPDVIMKSKKELKILGIIVINVTRKVSGNTLNSVDHAFTKFLHQLPPTVRERFYKKPFFNTIIYRYEELKDLMYRPRRWELPLNRVMERNNELRQNIDTLAREVLERVENFEGLT
ncbi:MAG: hypothetical protein B7O98_09020 [Zestosphaera tikiterensis]|uniref:AAA domain-containing protein n=1 Tax=Zestosphaera tikiterensis TaxID=1973259 RepID=A0A2R7Y256_9CREN|nr:MAG: hypothetical protein B7O98_09020 [Zestosphaera tikiterensis]